MFRKNALIRERFFAEGIDSQHPSREKDLLLRPPYLMYEACPKIKDTSRVGR